MEEGPICGEHVLLPRLDSKGKPVLRWRQGAIEGIRKSTRRQYGVVEVQSDRTIGVRSEEEEPSHAVGGVTVGGVSKN